MVCKLNRPSPQALFDRIKGNFSANVLGGFEVIPESLEWYVVSNDYAMAEEFYSITEAQWKARDPRYACCDDLYEQAALRGVYPKAADFAQGYVKVTGVAGSTIPSPIQFLIKSQTYTGIGSIPSIMPSAGFVAVRVQAISPGIEGNEPIINAKGTLSTPADGLDSVVSVFGSSFCGGSDEEDCESFRERYLRRLAYKPKANNDWLMEKILEWPCVTRVLPRSGSCCIAVVEIGAGCTPCGCNSCTNNLEFYPMFDNTFDCGIPPQCVIDDMNVWLFGEPVGKGLGEVEIGVCGSLYAPTPSMINVVLSGLGCATSTQIQLIKDKIYDLFRNIAPSEILTIRAIEILVAQVLGSNEPFQAVFEDKTGNMGFTACGDLDPACDILPCLLEIIVTDSISDTGVC